MRRKYVAWMLLPAALLVIIAVTLVLSNFQKEAGLAAPGKGGRAAVAAVAEARAAASGSGADGYDGFSKALAVAKVETKNVAITNAAETRLQMALTNALDCLSAAREAWQAELEQWWDPAADGSFSYWRTLHPALTEQAGGPLSAGRVREWAGMAADHWLQKALDLVE
jgi:hypothetical protein